MCPFRQTLLAAEPAAQKSGKSTEAFSFSDIDRGVFSQLDPDPSRFGKIKLHITGGIDMYIVFPAADKGRLGVIGFIIGKRPGSFRLRSDFLPECQFSGDPFGILMLSDPYPYFLTFKIKFREGLSGSVEMFLFWQILNRIARQRVGWDPQIPAIRYIIDCSNTQTFFRWRDFFHAQPPGRILLIPAAHAVDIFEASFLHGKFRFSAGSLQSDPTDVHHDRYSANGICKSPATSFSSSVISP